MLIIVVKALTLLKPTVRYVKPLFCLWKKDNFTVFAFTLFLCTAHSASLACVWWDISMNHLMLFYSIHSLLKMSQVCSTLQSHVHTPALLWMLWLLLTVANVKMSFCVCVFHLIFEFFSWTHTWMRTSLNRLSALWENHRLESRSSLTG